MKGSECRFVQYMEGSDKRFVIPVYQRNYDWKQENCRQLYDDLVRIIQEKRRNHFFGSIVSVYSPGHGINLLVIDGQQRLTTISLLLLAMHNLMEQKNIVPENSDLKQYILEEYLIDKWIKKEICIKLRPIEKDQAAFEKLFGDPSEYIRESNLTVNYEYFYNRILKKEISIDQLYDAICRLEIINIQLEPDDNPQLIFESLNSTGLDLSEGDKIRNFILMGLYPEVQQNYYKKYWKKIESCTKYDVSSFMRDYLSVKQRAIPQQNKVYVNFKDFFGAEKTETEQLLKEILAYAKRYRILLNGYSDNMSGGDARDRSTLNACIYRLNRLEITVTRPYFLEVLRLYDEGNLTLDQVADVFLFVESYLFRRTICNLPTNSLNKIFLMLHREIVRYDGTEDNYVEKLKYALQSKKENARFPDDEEFTAAFAERQVYLMSGKNKIYIFERFENGNITEDKDIYHHCDENTYSIEHIMPQHLTPEWQKELGDDYETIHEQWLHRLANLTLTAYNPKYSNQPFMEKKTMEKGFLQSGLRLNTWIARQNTWTLEELKLRNEFLMREAVSIWAKPTTEYKPAEKPLDACTLEDDADLTGCSISSFSFRKTEQPVTSWGDMYLEVLQMLYAEHQAAFIQLAEKLAETREEKDLAVHFSTKPEEFSKSAEIASGIYVWTNGPIKSKLSVLRRLFKLLHEDPEDLVFFLRDSAPAPAPVPRYELRKKYWTYALPIIQQAHGGEGSFSNVNPTILNAIKGFFGINSFYLYCAANFDSAQVKLKLFKKRKEENKQAFDRLAAHRAEIEAALGKELRWNRGDNIVSSVVSVTLNNVSIAKETDWPRMAKFQADWSKKFYDVLVPYIKSV